MKPRLEFRVFDTDLGDLHRAMQAAFAPLGEDRREDVYFLGADPARAWKLRDGRVLDLKCLLGTEGAFERWAPGGQVRLPAPGAEIAGAFGLRCGLPRLDPAARHDAGSVAAAFAATGAQPARAEKRRHRYDALSCRAEFVTVTCWRGTVDSVAIEGRDRGELQDLLLRLGLRARANLSFPAWLAMPALPPPGPAPSPAFAR